LGALTLCGYGIRKESRSWLRQESNQNLCHVILIKL